MNAAAIDRFQLTSDLTICRVLNGLWQVSGGHGRINPKNAIASMFRYTDAGFTTWDLADHYGPAEDLVGEFRRQLVAQRGEAALSSIQAFTKWVPRPGRMTRRIVEDNIDSSRHRMNTSTLDLLQFHWWNYGDRSYLDALNHLADLQAEGKIKHLALTNFDTEHLKQIVDHGIRIVSNQVQYSLIDRRPQVEMAQFCQQHDIHLLTYGTLCGGLLTARYLGKSEPSSAQLVTVSLRKYKTMIDNWGGWTLFQRLLETLQTISVKRGVSIANIAVRYILDQPAVAGSIIGARLGITQHIDDTARLFKFLLTPAEVAQIDDVLAESNNLFVLIGDCGAEYRH